MRHCNQFAEGYFRGTNYLIQFNSLREACNTLDHMLIEIRANAKNYSPTFIVYSLLGDICDKVI